MSEPYFIPDEWAENYRYAIEQARKDRPRYLAWLKEEIEIAIKLINDFDKIAILGGLAAKLIKATPNLYNHFLENHAKKGQQETENDKLRNDDDIEVLLEYAMSIATATGNRKTGVLPTHDDIELIYDQLIKIKINVNFWELSGLPQLEDGDADNWLKYMVVTDNINVRGPGYFEHVKELYRTVFEPHNGFMQQYYGFDSDDLMNVILKWDQLVYSKIGNPLGATYAMRRLDEWGKRKGRHKQSGYFPFPAEIRQFVSENPDLLDPANPGLVTSFSLDSIKSYSRIFWVIPEDEKEERIFNQLSLQFGANGIFFESKFKGFPQGDTRLKRRPLIQEADKYFHFSLTLPFRNIFLITKELILEADAIYYENYYRGNARDSAKDNCIERKVKETFEKMLPNAKFYHSLLYNIIDDEIEKTPELDILGLSGDNLYIIEVKAGEYNTKIKRGALKGLKDKLEETIGEGTYQCQRALKYIKSTSEAVFTYAHAGALHHLTISGEDFKSIYRITVTYEQLSIVGMNFKKLVAAGILNKEYEGSWIVSLYDLMVFRDLIESENDFQEYLHYRMSLYERSDVVFMDEIGVLGFYFNGGFPLKSFRENDVITMTGYDEEIKNYYNNKDMGLPNLRKPHKEDKKS